MADNFSFSGKIIRCRILKRTLEAIGTLFCASEKICPSHRPGFPFLRNKFVKASITMPFDDNKKSRPKKTFSLTTDTTSFTNLSQVNVLLSEKLLKEEIAHLESTRLLRVQLTAADHWTDGDREDFTGKRRDSSDLYFQSDRLRLLFKWCKRVCRLYGLKVRT